MWLKTEDGSYVNMDNVEFVWIELKKDKKFSIKAEGHSDTYVLWNSIDEEERAKLILEKIMLFVEKGLPSWEGYNP